MLNLNSKQAYFLSIILYTLVIIGIAIIKKDIVPLISLLVIPAVEIIFKILTTYRIEETGENEKQKNK